MEITDVAFHIILHGGNAKSFAMEAIAAAKRGEIEEARKLMDGATAELREAHHIQTSLIQEEAGGNKTEVTLLMIHAQDHLMNAITVKDLANEFIDLYAKINIEGGLTVERN
ncbi:PTS lactose/cellobiose transporter subunit IIA [Brevibacillus laterosporus]|uniref:PTS lactose/cellobiose transporter subunit IIA n=1 Tax=Brevibacillus TaxID=55080 RepID=UPI000319CFE3|nr:MULTISPECIES: PTS lactose/cellobiose transporter subunit IIA [Brevibacillus]AUM65791.1 PTS lactose/cellobiose transporter subunit IIA [Brevibacillus laterosporus]MBA4532394.1 PTS lactose/cellobiose transporter subunit IIA [Brevibacillus halotolerans]MCR8962533.1 PTS lactose/cellobiose transporter subunit IIA [Brevibacillus laterosporus]MCR8994761.1 PTS lactose/cellobiose transporter subunit IIA [Brevibacillus laterosporus]MCZ0834688.1 PTS lactose/cellobiose transporter subunit IIA [Brevibac